MAKVIYLGNGPWNWAGKFFDLVRAGEITHAVMLWRDNNGDVFSSLIGEEDLTYLIGLTKVVGDDLSAQRRSEG